MKDQRRLVITGLGPICAGGVGRDPLWKSVLAGRRPVRTYSATVAGVPWGTYPLYMPQEADVLGRSIQELGDLPKDPELRLSVAASRLAISDAGLEPEALGRAALVLTYEAPGIDRLLRGIFDELLRLRAEDVAEASGEEATPAVGEKPAPRTAAEFLDEMYRRHRDAVYSTHSFLHLHLAARALGIHGPTLFVNNACASGLFALEAVADQLRAGRCDLGIVASAEVPLVPTKHLWFQEAKVYSSSGSLRPFDRDREGLVLGVAGAALAVETLESARRRGARIYAEYLGGASSQEGWKVAVPNLTEHYYEETLREALSVAEVRPEEIDLLNPHGAGTPLGDLAEALGITAVFGPWPERPRITALKPYIGHTLGASALLETVILLLAMEHGVIPATPGFKNPDPKLKIRCVEGAEEANLRTVLKMSCGFAGFNAGAVFRAV